MLAQEVQQRIFQEFGTPKSPKFAPGDAIDLGWLGIPEDDKHLSTQERAEANAARVGNTCNRGTSHI